MMMMPYRSNTTAVYYALEQELNKRGEHLHRDKSHRLAFQSGQKFYIGSVNRGEHTIHYWWIYADEELMTIDESSGGVTVTGNLENPLLKIPQKEMTISQLEEVGDFEIPPVLMKELDALSEIGASVLGPLEYKACDVLLPLLGIKVIPESDAKIVKVEDVDWGVVRFYRPRQSS
ncbi:MAG: hypothetical protein E4H14_17035 [Candidatus Thorarchaeota archaeon]|nr:MAG: hypothetical protein E4H14_17035 [Candidatus Thorarchaeota archaeon]